MKYSNLTKEVALKASYGLALDVFVWEYVFDGEVDLYFRGDHVPGHEAPTAGNTVPRFSTSLSAAKILLIKMFSENPGLNLDIEYGLEWYDEAEKAGFVWKGNQIPVWRLGVSGRDGNADDVVFGRTLEESLCKLAIKLHIPILTT